MDLTLITDFPGYFISPEGIVFSSVNKGQRRDLNSYYINEIIPLTPRLNKHEYERVCLRDMTTGKRVDKYIHRLVAEALLPNPDNKSVVNHKDCVTNNNNVSNLEWATHKENNQQTIDLEHITRNELGQFESNLNKKS